MGEGVARQEAPLVSVVIPVKNEERHVLRCIDSVLHLQHPAENLEVVIVDNDSTDRSPALIAERCAGLPNVRCIVSHAATIAGVRMDGYAVTRGDIIGFIDGDTVAPASWLEIGLGVLGESDDISCVGFGIAQPEPADPWVERTWYGMSSGSRWSGRQEVPWLSSFNLLLKRSHFERVGGFDLSLKTCEDADLGFRLSRISRLIYSDRITMKHLGNVKTVGAFFQKEMWRGQGNLKQFWKSKAKKHDYKSVFAPIIYLISCLFLAAALAARAVVDVPFLLLLLPVLFVVGLPLFLTLRARPAGAAMFAQTSILYCMYLVARGVAVVRG